MTEGGGSRKQRFKRREGRIKRKTTTPLFFPLLPDSSHSQNAELQMTLLERRGEMCHPRGG